MNAADSNAICEAQERHSFSAERLDAATWAGLTFEDDSFIDSQLEAGRDIGWEWVMWSSLPFLAAR